jgi:hypothetical protein
MESEKPEEKPAEEIKAAPKKSLIARGKAVMPIKKKTTNNLMSGRRSTVSKPKPDSFSTEE